VDISFHKDRSLDFEFLKQASKAGAAGSILSLIPLPAASLAIVGTVADLLSSFYANSTTQQLVNSEEIDITKGVNKSVDLVIRASNQEARLPLSLQIDVKGSRLVDGGLVNGKFDKTQISQTLFENAQVVVAPGKTVSLVEALATASDEK